jgi:glycosyltransferase involved in cell wall biosynthesis
MALLTVGIPLFNEQRYLARTIESVLSQTFEDYTLIITDNASTDASYDIACSYAATDSRIRVIRHSRNVGALDNFRSSLTLAESSYFVWVGAHDIVEKQYFTAAIRALTANERVVMAYPESVLIDADDNVLRKITADVDTVGMPVRRRTLKVLRNSGWNAEIHGVFATAVLRRVPFLPVVAADSLMLFVAALQGDFVQLPVPGIRLRRVRQETSQERLERWRSHRVLEYSSVGLYVFVPFVLRHIECTLRFTNLPFLTRIAVAVQAGRWLCRRHQVSMRDLLREKYPRFDQAYCLVRRLVTGIRGARLDSGGNS